MKKTRNRPAPYADRRTRIGRRRHELVQHYRTALGHPPTAAEEALLDRAVALHQVGLEQLGEADDLDKRQRLANGLRRIFSVLDLVRHPMTYSGVKKRPDEATA
jgi:hypothetical protein